MQKSNHVVVVTGARHVPGDAVRWAAALSRLWSLPLTVADIGPDRGRVGELQRLAEAADAPQAQTVVAPSAELLLGHVDDLGRTILVLPDDGRRWDDDAAWGSFAATVVSGARHPVFRISAATPTSPRSVVTDGVAGHLDLAIRLTRRDDAEITIVVPHREAATISSLVHPPGLERRRVRLELVPDVSAVALHAVAERRRADLLITPIDRDRPHVEWLLHHTRYSLLNVPDARIPFHLAA